MVTVLCIQQTESVTSWLTVILIQQAYTLNRWQDIFKVNIWKNTTRIANITGSALALHCCKAHAKMNRKIENSTPCKIVTHKDFNFKLGTRDYVTNTTHRATLGSNRPSRGFPPNRENITLLLLFCYTVFFLDPAPRSNRRTDCYTEWLKWRVSAKDGPFGVYDDEWRHMGKVFPKNSPKRGVNRQFQAKTPKSLHRNISGTINATN